MAWWTRTAEKHLASISLIRSGKGVELKDGTAYTVTVAMREGEERALVHLRQATPAAELDQLEPAQ